MKNKILYIICTMLAIMCLYQIYDAYALFESKKNMVVNNSIGKWNIHINDNNIGTTKDFIIDSFTLEENEEVSEGKLAPGTTGYFDILIDPKDTSVSIRYDLTFDFNELSNSFTIDKIEETNQINLIKTGENTYTNIIKLDDIKNGTTNNIRVYISWNNNEENNSIDSQIGMTEDNSIKIPIVVNVNQYLNETIEPYDKLVE